jgi:5-methylcytosine-specific restriction endonuclease McrA
MKSKRTKACEIKPKVREAVEERDNHCCVFCGSPNARGEAHIVRRSQGGLGIEQNLLTVCRYCHRQFDEGHDRELYMNRAVNYMKEHYPDWNIGDLVYKKGFLYD